jgi:putative FmdB family regulatory protein
MPLYEYQCKKCGHRFEKIQKFSRFAGVSEASAASRSGSPQAKS